MLDIVSLKNKHILLRDVKSAELLLQIVQGVHTRQHYAYKTKVAAVSQLEIAIYCNILFRRLL